MPPVAVPVQVYVGGDALFSKTWSAAEGAGPLANAQSCAACHATPRPGGAGREPESLVLISDEERDDTGGHVFRRFLLRPGRAVVKRPLPRRVFTRRAPALFGLGLLEQVPLDAVAAGADPDDRDGDGISGRLPSTGGRFGWKSRFTTLEQAVAAALINELGLTSPIFPAGGGSHEVEVTAGQLARLTAFVRGLPPPPRGLASGSVPTGEASFREIGCASCHTPRLPASASATSIAAYTDLLLHDMGPALADGFPEGDAAPAEFRTPPLWGLASTGPPFLHDGRADSVDMAIRLHDGEAAASRQRYERLTQAQRAALVRFLNSL